MSVGSISYMSFVSHMSIFLNRLKSLVSNVFKKFVSFSLIYKYGKPRL